MLCGITDGRHDRSRRGKNQGAWAEYNQDGYCANNFPAEKPSEGSSTQSNNDDPGCPSVRKSNNFSFPRIGRLHQTDHTLDGAILTDLGCFHFKGSKLVDRTGRNLVTHRFVYRQGLSSHDRLVDRSLT